MSGCGGCMGAGRNGRGIGIIVIVGILVQTGKGIVGLSLKLDVGGGVTGGGQNVVLQVVPAVELPQLGLLGVGAVVGIDNRENAGFGLRIKSVVGYDILTEFSPVFTARNEGDLTLVLRIVVFNPLLEGGTALAGDALVGSDGTVDGTAGNHDDRLNLLGQGAFQHGGDVLERGVVTSVRGLDAGASHEEEDVVFFSGDPAGKDAAVRSEAGRLAGRVKQGDFGIAEATEVFAIECLISIDLFQARFLDIGFVIGIHNLQHGLAGAFSDGPVAHKSLAEVLPCLTTCGDADAVAKFWMSADHQIVKGFCALGRKGFVIIEVSFGRRPGLNTDAVIVVLRCSGCDKIDLGEVNGILEIVLADGGIVEGVVNTHAGAGLSRRAHAYKKSSEQEDDEKGRLPSGNCENRTCKSVQTVFQLSFCSFFSASHACVCVPRGKRFANVWQVFDISKTFVNFLRYK